MSVYRYRADLVTLAALTRRVGSPAPTLATASPSFVDITYTGLKADLDEVMALDGFVYVSTDPSDTPTAAAAALLSSGAAADPRDVVVFDHFVFSTTTSDTMGWRTLVSGTGADLALSGEAGHPGIIDLGAGTASTGRTCVYRGDAGNLWILPGASQPQIEMEWLIRLPASSLLATNCDRITVGLGDQWGAGADVEHANGIYLEFRPVDAAFLRLTTASASTRTKTSTSTTVVAGTWYRIGLRVTFPGGVPTVQLLVNGAVAATHTTDIPVLGVGAGIRIDGGASVATEARVQADYVLLQQVTTKET